MRRRPLLASAVVLALAGSAFAAYAAFSSFLGAPAGVAVAFTEVALPVVDKTPPAVPPKPVAAKSAFAPKFDDLVNGNTVITTEKQMKEVWRALFKTPYDATLFDFQNDFVVMMGGGAMSLGGFGISSVESVDAQWSDAGGFGGFGGGSFAVEPFLAVTSTLFLPGVMPIDPPSPTWRVSAVRVSKSAFADVVFHRSVILGV